ncbi:DNA internalization-related competence protein ComEC/Rec2 [Ornithinibacillus sp. 179-J 7C1 HS]|uniref:DNA internalization-related competence protein ComEC/Rec2 n=1 Tax=Ornithinibacillus sp. 179-J 7C1 HS TaxID=3142384 RepID=UPI0039A0DA3F
MKGYWYILAFAAVCSAISIIYNTFFCLILFIIWVLYLNRKKRLGKIPIITSLVVYLMFLLLIPPIESIHFELEPFTTTVTGKIIGSVTSSDTILQFDLKDDKTENLIKVTLFQPDFHHPDISNIKSGAECTVEGEVRLPEDSRNPGQFNYQRYLATNGIYYEMLITSLDSLYCDGQNNLSLLHTVRLNLMNYLLTRYSEEASSWIIALALGDDRFISEEVTELFQRWGLSHLLAISGLHIGLVVGLLYFVMIKLQFLTIEKAQSLMVLLLPIYAFLAGGEPSVLRASLMVIIVIIMRRWRWKLNTLDVISIAFLSLILMNPYIIYHIGFQLSFLVSFGIILSKNWLLDSGQLLFQMIKLSFISQLMIVPLQILYFYNFNPLSILLNIFVVPYFTFFVIPLMFVLLFISPFPFITELLDKLFTFIQEGIFLKIVELVDLYAYFPWFTGQFPTMLLVLYYGLFVLMMKRIQLAKLNQAFSCGIILTILLVYIMVRPYLSPYGSVTMLDIGQGDAIVIELPFRRGVFIVDAGGAISFEGEKPTDTIYKKVVKPFLQYRGIKNIDAIFISHEDTDHNGSIPYLLEDFEVKKVIVSEFYQFENELLQKVANKKVLRVKAGQTIDMKGKRFKILSPRVDKKGSNENSLVFQTTLGGKNWLFTGDIDKETEKAILHSAPDLSVDILKVAHHGSNTSTDQNFISATKPDYALISVGKNNRYGHPNNEVLEVFEKENVYVLRTDQSGAIIYRFNENNGTFYQFNP